MKQKTKHRWTGTADHPKCCPDHIDQHGQFHATGTGRYPQDHTFEVFFPEAASFEHFYWFGMEAYLRRYSAETWWSYTIPGPPAIWRVRIENFHPPTRLSFTPPGPAPRDVEAIWSAL